MQGHVLKTTSNYSSIQMYLPGMCQHAYLLVLHFHIDDDG